MKCANTSSGFSFTSGGSGCWRKKQASSMPMNRNMANCSNTTKPLARMRPAGVALAAGAQIALHHRVVGAVRADRQHRAADQRRPKTCRARVSDSRMSNICSLPVSAREPHDLAEAAGNLAGDDEHRRDSAEHVHDELNAVVPDHRPHAADERIDRRDRRPSRRRSAQAAMPASFCSTIADQKQPQAVAQVAGDQKQQRRRPPRQAAESLVRAPHRPSAIARENRAATAHRR